LIKNHQTDEENKNEENKKSGAEIIIFSVIKNKPTAYIAIQLPTLCQPRLSVV
jgi:hypothetical protein